MLQEQSRLFQRVLFFADFGLVALAWAAAYFTRFGLFPLLAPLAPGAGWLTPAEWVEFSRYLWLLPWVLIAASLVFYFSGLYAPDRALRFLRLSYTALKAGALALVGVAALLSFYRAFSVSRLFMGLFGLYTVAFLVGLRFVLYFWLKRQRARGRFRRRVLIVGGGAVGKRLARSFRQYPWMGLEVVGFADDDPARAALCSVADVPALVDRYQAEGLPIDHVYLALPLSAADQIAGLVDALSTRLAHVSLAPDLFGLTVLNARVSDVDGLPIIHLIDEVPLRLAWVAKRGLDIALSALFLLAISPVFGAIALAVRLGSPGPIFYRQQRMSLNGHTFDMLKFRSMRTDQAGDVNVLTAPGDPRVTRVGAFLRRTSLDELPQFINVLRGDMSIVGPRPERTWVVEELRGEIPHYILKHKVPAGITGWAQVNGWRGNTSLEKRIEYDLYYIQNWSLKLDFKIMVMTVWKGFVSENAY